MSATRDRPKLWRVVLVLLLGLGALGWVYADNRWGVDAELADWGGLEVHEFGRGPVTVVLLHGFGASPDYLVPFAHRVGDRFGARYLLPLAPHRVAEGYAWFRWPDEAGGEEAHRRDIGRTRRMLTALVTRARHEGAEHVVIAGHSMGGRMAMDVGLSLESPPSAIALLASHSLSTWDPRRVAGQRVFMAAGERDHVFALRDEERLRDRLVGLRAELTYFTHPGGHEAMPIADELGDYLNDLFPQR